MCFVLLFLQLNNIQVKNAHTYATSAYNPAVIQAKYDQPRGIIQSADGVVLAQSVRTNKGSYKYVRQYPTGSLFSQITGYLPIGGLPAGVEATYGRILPSTTARSRPSVTCSPRPSRPTPSPSRCRASCSRRPGRH